jgi:hypothetical protein
MKPDLTPHEESTVAQLKALLNQWPKTLVLELEDYTQTVKIYKRKGVACATEAASFRKPSLFL